MPVRSHSALAALALLALGAPSLSSPASTAAPALAERYRVRLESAWPQLPAGAGCVNGGNETVEGVLTRTGSEDYAGSFTRTTHLLFCGAHGVGGDACALTLDGEGGVEMRGVVVTDERSPSGRALRVAWTPDSAHLARASGACGADFKEKVERMYLSVRHGVEFALPKAGAAPRRERLEDFAWTVEVE
jgi:hypothetical protein